MAVILVVIGLTSETLQSAITYQRQRNLATRCSSLLDSVLLSPGVPPYWGTENSMPTVFGIQDPDSIRNKVSPFSLVRLKPETAQVYYSKTASFYNNVTVKLGDSLLVPVEESVNYTSASRLLGTNETYGFRMSVTPIVTLSILETQLNPLEFSITAQGTGSPLSNGTLKYCLLMVDFHIQGDYPTYSLSDGTAFLDDLGSTLLSFPTIDGSSRSFVLFAYASLSGLVGMDYYKKTMGDVSYVVPLVASIEEGEVILAHLHDIDGWSNPTALAYNATLLLIDEDLTLASNSLQNSTGLIESGGGEPYRTLTVPKNTCGILAITYRRVDSTTGISLMPLGAGSLSFSIGFGENPTGEEWVSTSMRQVVVDKIGYQITLSLWSLEGYEVIGR